MYGFRRDADKATPLTVLEAYAMDRAFLRTAELHAFVI